MLFVLTADILYKPEVQYLVAERESDTSLLSPFPKGLDAVSDCILESQLARYSDIYIGEPDN